MSRSGQTPARLAVCGLALALLLGLLAPVASPRAAAADSANTPEFVGAPYFAPGQVYTQNFPDPDIVYDAGTDKYYAYATTTGGVNVPAMTSPDAVTWTAKSSGGALNANGQTHDALPQPIPGDVSYRTGSSSFPADLWAPGVGKVGSRWVMFYALRIDANGRRCLAYATSATPGGQFLNPKSFYCSGDPMGSIDPEVFTDPASGTTYLVWKDEGMPGQYGQRSWARPIQMADANTVQFVPGSNPLLLLESTNNWEAYTAESPTLTRMPDGGLALFYSGNRWDTDNYATGMARCAELSFSWAALCTRTSAAPMMSRRPGRKSIGAPSVTTDRNGGLLIATHSWSDALPAGYNTSNPSNQRRLTVEHLYEVAGRTVVSTEPGPVGAAPAVGYTSMTPVRVLDTRDGTGTTGPRSLEAGEVFVLDLSGRVPATTSAVVLNLTVDGATNSGFVTAYPCGSPPNTSNLNYPGATVVPDLATVRVNASRRVCLYTLAPTHLVVDLQGRYDSASTDGLTGVGPVRVLDTRSGSPVAAGSFAKVTVAGSSAGFGVPAGAKAVVVNLTADRAASSGYLTAYSCDTGRPLASSANYTAGVPASNAVVVPVAADGSICVFSLVRTDVIIDLFGYIATGGATFTSRTPVRLKDTRDLGPRVPGGGVLEVQVVGAGAAPVGTKAVVLTVTATDAPSDGWVGAYPCASPPTGGYTSNLNIRGGETRAAHVTVPVGADGKVCLITLSQTHLIVDLAGSFS